VTFNTESRAAWGSPGMRSAKSSRIAIEAVSVADTVELFLTAMETAGIFPLDRGAVAQKVAASPGLVRFICVGERKANGWARLFLDNAPAGSFGNWRLGIKSNWRFGGSSGRSVCTVAQITRAIAERHAAQIQTHDLAAARCVALWQASGKAEAAHPYLLAKQMASTGLRMTGGALLVPMMDDEEQLQSLQCIYGDGMKRFAAGGRVKGLQWQCGEQTDTILIGEGVATMAAVHAATGLYSIAALSAANLSTVANAARCRRPSAKLIFCADDDADRSPNIGLEAATAAARKVGGRLALPPRPRGLPDRQSWDFADVWLVKGGDEAIRRVIGFEIGGGS
jgi:putative DNA primase/helicase